MQYEENIMSTLDFWWVHLFFYGMFCLKEDILLNDILGDLIMNSKLWSQFYLYVTYCNCHENRKKSSW